MAALHLPDVAGLARTTPGALAILGIVLTAAMIAFGLVASASEHSRLRAARAARSETEPRLLEAVALYSALADAHATTTGAFLAGGLEPTASRNRYLRDLRTGSSSLTKLTAQVEPRSRAGRAVATMAENLPTYTGLIESARADNRQGFPVGVAYLRQASDVLSTTLLPAAGELYSDAALRLGTNLRSGTSTSTLLAFLLEAVVVLAVFALVLWRLAQLSHRILSVPAAVGVAIVVALTGWGMVALAGEQSALARAQRTGSDPLEVLAATRILASRAQSDEALTLISRGGDVTHPADFTAVIGALGSLPAHGPGRGLLGELDRLGHRAHLDLGSRDASTALGAYTASQARVSALLTGGELTGAIKLANAGQSSSGSAAERLVATLDEQLTDAQRRFDDAADDAVSALDGLGAGIAVMVLAATGLALIGIAQRIGEYR